MDTETNPTPPEKENKPEVIPANCRQVEVLKKCIEEQIKVFRAKGRSNKKGAIIVQTFIIILSATTTIFIGWKIGSKNESSPTLINFALITSAVTTGLTMLYNFFDYKELWAQYKIAANELEAILAELTYLQGWEIQKKDLDRIFDSYSSVCKSTNSAYKQIRMSKDTTSDA